MYIKRQGDKSVIPSVAPYYYKVDGENVLFTPEQRIEYQKTTGRISNNAVHGLTNNEQYKKLSKADKAEVITAINNYSSAIARELTINYEIPASSWAYKAKQALLSGVPVEDYTLLYYTRPESTSKESLIPFLDASGLSQEKEACYIRPLEQQQD